MWSYIATQIREEKEAKEKATRLGQQYIRTVTISVWMACANLGFNKDHMLAAIDIYGSRDDVVHTNIKTIIKKCRWGEPANLLHRDLDELPRLIPPSRAQDLDMVRTIYDRSSRYVF